MANNPARDHEEPATERDDDCDSGQVPPAVQYLCSHGEGPQAIFIPCKNEDQKIVIVAEPGEDPAELWRALCDFMDAAEIPHA